MFRGAKADRWLVIGLGNPGPDYEKTRHNIGAMLITSFADRMELRLTSHKSRANVAEYKIGVAEKPFPLFLRRYVVT